MEIKSCDRSECRYCEGSCSDRKFLWDKESNGEVLDGEFEVEYFDEQREWYAYAKFKIDFCPMCGRKLGDRDVQ